RVADEDEFLAAVAPACGPLRLQPREPVGMVRPALARHRRPPVTCAFRAADRAGEAEVSDPGGPGREPEQALGADQAGPGARGEVGELLGMERTACAIDEAGD